MYACLQQAFDQADLDDDGFVDRNEFHVAMRMLRYACSISLSSEVTDTVYPISCTR